MSSYDVGRSALGLLHEDLMVMNFIGISKVVEVVQEWITSLMAYMVENKKQDID